MHIFKPVTSPTVFLIAFSIVVTLALALIGAAVVSLIWQHFHRTRSDESPPVPAKPPAVLEEEVEESFEVWNERRKWGRS